MYNRDMDATKSPEILINKLFAGAYLSEGENIGHEVINLFKADDGANYLYITPSGVVDLENHLVTSVIFVRNLEGKTTVEVIAKAEDLSPVSDTLARNLTYAGAPLSQIFRANTFHGNQHDISSAMASFRSDRVRTPKAGTRLILTIDPDFVATDPTAQVVYFRSNSKAIDNQSSRKYYSSATDPEAYCVLQQLLDSDALWESRDTTEKLIADRSANYSGPTFLEIIRKENDELIFSNLLAYYFQSDPKLFQKFATDVLGVPDFHRAFDIVRETNDNIDLWIEDADTILVIENKIKSSLNGIKSDNYSQLNKYQEYAESRASNPDDDAYGKSVYYFIFTPDYNLFDIDKYCLDKPYRTVKYSEIYRFFRRNAASYVGDRYFADFLKGLRVHTMSMSELNFSVMRSRFMEQIRRIA